MSTATLGAGGRAPGRGPRALLVTRWYPTRQEPVAAPFIQDQAVALLPYAVPTVLHLARRRDQRPPLAFECEDDPGVHRGVPTYRSVYRRPRHRRWRQPIAITAALAGVAALERLGQRFDLVHGHFHGAALATRAAARLLGLPYLLTEHSSHAAGGGLPPLQRLIARLGFAGAAATLAVSRTLADELVAERLAGSPPIVLPNAVDLATFRPRATPAGSGGPPYRLVAVTRMTPVKGIDILLAALARLARSSDARSDSWHCDLIGGGEATERYRRLAGDLGLTVTCEPAAGPRVGTVRFLGELPRERVAAELATADLFVLASHRETFSVATVEALASGVPVVVTACGGPAELVDREIRALGGGAVVPPDDPEALAAALARSLAALPGPPPDRLAAAVERRFGPAAVGRRLAGLYRHVAVTGGYS